MSAILIDGNDWLLALRHITDIEKARTLTAAKKSAALAAKYLRTPLKKK